MTATGPLFRREETGLLVGAALWAAGIYVWWRTYSSRTRTPLPIRIFSPL
jgi:hypothetical protein